MLAHAFRAVAAVALAASPALALAQKKPSDITVEQFFKKPQYSQMVLSPDGRKLAALTPLKDRDNLVVVDLDKRTHHVITNFETVDATGIFWVNNKRLCMRVILGHVASGEPNYRGMYCIDADGENIRNFSQIAGIGGNRGLTEHTPVYDESGDFIMTMRQRSRRSADVYRFNTNTGRYQILTADSPGDVVEWVLDRNLVPRVAVSAPERKDKGKPRQIYVWHRAGADAKWELLWQFADSWGMDDTYDPIAFDYDNETLYVATNKGRDKMAVYAYDTKSKKMGNLLLEHPLIDVRGGLLFSHARRKLVGVAVNAEKPVRVWTEPEFARVQQAVDGALRNTFNIVNFARGNEKRALVFATSDVDSGTYYLYDGDRKSIEPVAKTREWLDPSLMAERRFITYKARDGMEIPAWVTIPKGGGKNLPLVVNIHGGPWGRSYSWTSVWQSRWPEAQYFASRGYVVLEPEPRGSTGWGRKHYASSFKQWGLTMQDDITDGALHLVKEGLVDRNRMCLHGGSYGGYATLQGLAKDPDLWKCGSAFVAVSDLGLMQEVTYSDTSILTDFLEEDFPHMVGDKDKDRALFDRVSPARNAGKFKAPLLLVMGSNDVRVPQVHGDTMRSNLDNAGKKVEYVVYPGEGHGFNRDENVVDFYTRVMKLFDSTLR